MSETAGGFSDNNQIKEQKVTIDPRPSFYDPTESKETSECPRCRSDLIYDCETTTLHCGQCGYTEYVTQPEDLI